MYVPNFVMHALVHGLFLQGEEIKEMDDLTMVLFRRLAVVRPAQAFSVGSCMVGGSQTKRTTFDHQLRSSGNPKNVLEDSGTSDRCRAPGDLRHAAAPPLRHQALPAIA